MPNTILKRWNGTAFEELYPKTTVGQIAASGTANSTTFLRGDGQWATPSDVDTNNYLTGVSGSGNGTVTFTRQGLSNLTWDASHNHSIGFFNSAITGNLDTLFGNGQFGFANTTTGRPEDYGQGINIINSGTAYNSTDNWITQLAFGTAGSTSYFRTKVNTGAWTAWRKIWNDANDGTGSGLDADLLDGQHGSYFLDTSGSTQTKSGSLNVSGNFVSSNNITGGRYYQSTNGVPTNNLGSPTVTEMSLFDEQFYNQTAFYDITKLKFYTSTDGSNWTEVTSISDANKRALVGGDSGSSIVIPNLTPYYRIEITNNGNYVFLNALYMYWSSNSHSTTVKMRARRRSDETFVQWTNSSTLVSSWPGHLYMPFNTIPFLTGGTSSGHYDIVQIDFQPTWAGGAYSGTSINLYKLQIWGGYPAGKRNIYSTDENKNVAFPAALTGTRLFSTIATGTSPLSVTSTTVNTNLNADLLDGNHASAFVLKAGDTSTGLTVFDGGIHVLSGTGGGKLRIKRNSNSTDGDDIVDIHLDDNSIYFDMDNDNDNDTGDFFFRYKTGGTFSNLLYIGPGTINYKGNTIWHAGNDGASSGLDADKVDNLEASQFIRSDEGDTAAGNHEFYGTDTSGSYAAAPIEIKEVNLVSNTQTADIYAPKLAFHWGGITQTSIFLSANGNLYLNGGQNGKILTTADEGSGNGIDADTLDGNHASAFLQTTARGAANGVAPLGSDSKVPLANLPDFLTGSGRGFFLAGTLSSNTSLSGVGGLVQTLSGLATGGEDYKNLYGATWVATAQLNISWTDQTTINPYTYHVLSPGDESDSTSPVTLEAGDMIVFTKYLDNTGDGDDEQFTFSIINSSDPRFANYLPLTGGTLTGNLALTNASIGLNPGYAIALSGLADATHRVYHDASTDYDVIDYTTGVQFRHYNLGNQLTLTGSNGNVGIGTTSPAVALQVATLWGVSNDGVTQWGSSRNQGIITWDANKVIIGGLANNALELRANNATHMTINTSGRVGIGTSNLSQKLHVYGTGDTAIQIHQENVNATLLGSKVNDSNFYITNATSAGTLGTADRSITLASSGNVGIGTTSPEYNLHIKGSSNTGIVLENTSNSNKYLMYARNGVSGTEFSIYDLVGNADRFGIDASGNVGIGTTSPVASLHIASPTTAVSTRVIRVGSGSTTTNNENYIEFPSSTADVGTRVGGGREGAGGASFLRLHTVDSGGVVNERMRITSNGNVGIGTSSPSEKLDVVGNIAVSGTVDGVDIAALNTTVSGKQDAATALTTSTSFGGDVSGTYNAIVVADDSHNHIISNVDGLQTALDGKASTSHTHAISDVTNLQTSLDAKAALASPALTGTPTAPTATAGTNTTQIATTAFVSTAVANLINSAPGALDTLDELAAALGDDANFASTITTSLAGKASTVHTHTKSDITDFGHSHGNITNTGTINSTTVTPGDQDRILIADSSASGSIERGIIIGTGTTTFLRNDGQWATPADTTTLTSLGLTATATELNYVDGVTSAIQTQLDGKAATSHTHTASQISDSGNVGRNLLTTASATASTLFFKKNPDHTITLEDAATFRTSTGTAASSHTHSAADITSGTLVVGRGGTGTTTAPTAGGIIWATSTSAYASTALGTSGQFLQSAGTSTPTWQNLTTNITTISNLAPNTYSSSFSVTGYRWVIITGFKNSALTEVVFQTWVDLNDANQYSTTARTRRIVWNNDTSTFGDDLTIQNSTGLRLQFAAGINFTYRLDGVR